MIIILIIFVAVIGAAVLLNIDTTDAVMDEFCRLECKERKIRDYSICC